MDMYQKREQRAKEKLVKSEAEKDLTKSTIHWFPGHMTRAKRQMQEAIKTVDMVIEIRDSRIPKASQNPMIEELIQAKPRLILLSKKDKGDLNEIDRWIKYLTDDLTMVVAVDLIHDNVIEIIVNACKKVMKPKIDKQIARGIRPRAIRAMVVGIPNVGKSTLINRIAKKKIAETANRPGVTRALQWIKLNKDLELLDTPGVLWPKFEDQEVGILLALTGAIRDQVVNLEEIAAFAMKRLIEQYPQQLQKLYGVELIEDPYKMIEAVGSSKKLIKANDEVDYDRAIDYFIKDIRDDKCGRITWEKVNEQDYIK